MNKIFLYCIPLIALLLLAGFQPQGQAPVIDDTASVEATRIALGGAPAEHQVDNTITGVSVEAGRKLVHQGVAMLPEGGGKTNRQSKHFVCTSCHNTEKEDPDLRYADPEARLTFTSENGLPFLPGTTLYGAVNRRTYYNGDYEKKYGDLVRPARQDLRGAIALCATECAQGRPLADWEMESILAYLWTLELKVGDLVLQSLERDQITAALAGEADKSNALQMLDGAYLDHSPATFLLPPEDRKAGYAAEGDPTRGALIYDQSCLHCHGERRYSFFNLDDSSYSFDFLTKHLPTYSRYSTYQVVRYGTSPMAGKRAYMPHYTQERMSDGQVEDLRAYLEREAQ